MRSRRFAGAPLAVIERDNAPHDIVRAQHDQLLDALTACQQVQSKNCTAKPGRSLDCAPIDFQLGGGQWTLISFAGALSSGLLVSAAGLAVTL